MTRIRVEMDVPEDGVDEWRQRRAPDALKGIVNDNARVLSVEVVEPVRRTVLTLEGSTLRSDDHKPGDMVYIEGAQKSWVVVSCVSVEDYET